MVIVYRHIEGDIKGYIGTERALLKTGKCAAILHELDRTPERDEMLDQVTGQIVPRPPTEAETDRASLRDQILAETPEQWAARATAERWLIVLRILKHWARST